MFERFTTQARDSVVRAQGEARQLGHRHIGTEHLLLVLLDPPAGVAYTVLHGAGLDAQRVRADIVRLVQNPWDLLGEKDAAALEAIGIDLDAVRAKIEETFGPGALEPDPPAPRRGIFRRRAASPRRSAGGHIPFTPRAKKVLELSLREALHLRHNHIGTEHILLGLLREGQGLAAKVIADAGIDADDLRQQTIVALTKAA